MTEPIEPARPSSLWARFKRLFPWWPDRGPRQPQTPVRDPKAAIERAQADLILRAFAKEGGVGGIALSRNEEVDEAYLCHRSRVLCRLEDVGRLNEFFGAREREYVGGRGVRELVGDLVAYELPTRVEDKGPHVENTLADIERDNDGDSIARPDHILYVTTKGYGSMCPADEPQPAQGKATLPAPVSDESLGKDIRISVVDTGWYPPAATDSDSPWLASGVGGDVEQVNPAKIHPYAGHGTFVAGVVRCLAPAATIDIEGVLKTAGAVYESDITRELNEAMVNDPDLISISAGCRTRRDIGLLGFEVLSEIFSLVEGEGAPLVVAAAGNDSSNRKFWPAAFPWVVSVGALDDNMEISDFSNYGDWVQVYAHGRDLVNAYPTGTYICYEPPNVGQVRTFTGMAQWSGTSFATPIVTGTIAARMTQNQLGARGAIKALRTGAKTVTDKVGNTRPVVGPPFS